MAIALFFSGHWFLSLFSQTFFLHRYSAHQMFTMNKFWERFFHIFTFISQGSSYLNARAYAILHRLHHKHSDELEDPHSPSNSANVFMMMWKTARVYANLKNNRIKIDPSMLKNIPDWTILEKIGDFWLTRILWGIGYFIFYLLNIILSQINLIWNTSPDINGFIEEDFPIGVLFLVTLFAWFLQ